MTEALDTRSQVAVLWSRRLRQALDAEVKRRRAESKHVWPVMDWDMSRVSEDILRQALGVGED